MLNRYRDVFKCFRCRGVKYVVIGGIAAVLHGVPRATFDLGLLIEATPENAKRLLAALLEAGMRTAALTTPEEVLANEITVCNDRARLDVQTSAPGVAFAEAWRNRCEVDFEGQEICVLSKPDLVRSKRAAGRPVDMEGARLLELPDNERP